MKIAILGTRGIPNNYGGFEQFAEKISVKLVEKGHDVIVFNPSYHPYEKSEFIGVKIVKKRSPEKFLGPFANYIYDFLCLKNAIKNKCDLVLACGYTSSPLTYIFFKLSNFILVSNMDGLEWKRSKWGFFARKLIQLGEKLAVKKSHYLIADNLCIAEYLKEKFNKSAEYISYAAEIVKQEYLEKKYLEKYGLQADTYYLIVGRGVPENNFEKIIKGFLLSKSQKKLVIVTNSISRCLKHAIKEYMKNKQIVFIEGIYNKKELDILRYFSAIYFHGHSVGGTNPSLLEAMASKCLICADDNVFNKSVLGEDGLYFETENDVKNQILSIQKLENSKNKFVENNIKKIQSFYNWDKIADQYEKFFIKILESKNG